MAADLIDANVLLRHLTGEHIDHSPRATRFIADLERGARSVHLSDLVLSEVVWTLRGLYKRSRSDIRDALVQVVHLAGVSVDDQSQLVQALDLYADSNLSFVDAYLVSKMLAEGVDAIVSFDRGFDRVPGVTRIEP